MNSVAATAALFEVPYLGLPVASLAYHHPSQYQVAPPGLNTAPASWYTAQSPASVFTVNAAAAAAQQQQQQHALASSPWALFTPPGIKRCHEDLLCPLNGPDTMPPQPTKMSTIDNEAKKVKLDQMPPLAVATPTSPGRSKVVHLRNTPQDMTETELVNICLPFGRIVNYLLLKTKNQAFVEFDDEQSAQNMVTLSTANAIQMRGRTIFVQFSNHQQLKTDKPGMQLGLNTALVGALQMVNQAGSPGSMTGDVVAISTQQQPNSVLRVIIENMLYPVTLDILHQIFSRFGKVLRIITFSKNNTFQALIQFSEANAAQLAKTALDGQNVYSGCCTLRIDYSKLATLNVKYNNDKSRDYTNPNLPSGEITIDNALALTASLMAANGGLSQLNPNAFSAQSSLLNSAALSAALQQNGQVNAGGMQSMNGGFPGLNFANAQNSALAANMAGLRLPGHMTAMTMSPVILVSNLDEEKVTCDALFTLFGVYGDVQRVKILYNKKDNALIQYAEPSQAQICIQHLDKVKIWGKQIRVTASKHMNVQMPKEGQPDAGLTKDYSQSPLHRFKKPGSKNYMNIYPPSATLHLSNIPPNITEEFLIQAFAEQEFTVKQFKFFPKDHKMALAQMHSVEDALVALVGMHNYKLADNAHLRVSFSKSGI